MDRRSLLTYGGVFALAAGGSFAWQNWSSGRDSASDLVGFGAANAQEAGEIDTSIVEEMSIGDPDAPVKIIEYASATCPHCASFHQNTYKLFKENYVDTGKVHFTYREVYFDRFGLWAGMVARCGGSERYFGLIDLIFAQQRTWARGESPQEIAESLKTIGRTAGLTNDELDACLQDEDMARAMVAAYQENQQRDGIRSTPSFLINGTLVTGDQSYEAFSALIDAELG